MSDDGKTPLPPEEYHFQCINHKRTQYVVMANSPSANQMVGTPVNDYFEWLAYWNKIADVVKKEFLNKAGKK
jgi:hypothetical protein